MKKLILCLALSLTVLAYDWPVVDINSIDGSMDSDGTLDSSDPTDEYADSDKSDTLGICWMQSYARYGHSPISKCEEGMIQIGSYCYQACKEGYTDGYFSGLYSEVDSFPDGLETTSDVESYCWENCPKGYQDDYQGGCYDGNKTIEKKSYNRTYAYELECPAGLEFDGETCYPPAKEGFSCYGQICLGKCPKGWGKCGVLCAKLGSCKGEVLYEGFDVSDDLDNMADNIKNAAQGKLVNATAIPAVRNGTKYPFCH